MASTTDWKQLPDSIIDPITLEPINELAVEPFKIGTHYFDGEALAAYLVASSTFENPLDRKALTRDDCQRLDAHLVRNKLKRLGVERERRAAQRRAPGPPPPKPSARYTWTATLRRARNASQLGRYGVPSGCCDERAWLLHAKV